MSKSVQRMGHKRLKVQQHSICRQHDVAESSALRRKVSESRNKADCADENIDVQCNRALDLRCLENFCTNELAS